MSARGVGLCALGVLSIAAVTARARAEEPRADEPWEPFDAASVGAARRERPAGDGDVLREAAHRAIAGYRTNVGPASVKRCPFAVSCSLYADGLVRRYGVFGLFAFLDRFFLREHPFAFALYALTPTEDGALRLDDHALE